MPLEPGTTVIRRRVKHLRLRVKEDGTLEIVAPWWLSTTGIAAIVRRKARWIERLRTYFRAHPATVPAFAADEIMLFGMAFKVVREPGLGRAVAVERPTRTIRTGRELTLPIQQTRWLRAYAKLYLVQRLRELGQQHGLAFNRVTIRAQRTRWGSCSARRNISLNWRLVRAPPHVIDYVLLHELLHTRVLNHSRDFWAQLQALCPGHRDAQAWLKQNHQRCR